MKKILSFLAIMSIMAAPVLGNATKNIHILIDTGATMRDDGVVENIYRLAGSYVADFVRNRHNDNFGKNVNITIQGVVKHKDGPTLQTISYVNRKSGSPLDLSAFNKMDPNPPDWTFAALNLDKNGTNLDLFETKFFAEAANTVFVVISNSNVGKKTFFGKMPLIEVNSLLDIHKATFPNNVRVYLIHLPNAGSSGERVFKTEIVPERITAGLEAAWKEVIYAKPRATLTFDFMKNGKVDASYTAQATATPDKPVLGVYAPVDIRVCAGNAIAVQEIQFSGASDIPETTCRFQNGKNAITRQIASLEQQGTYKINAKVVGKNGDVYTRSFTFEVFSPLVFDIIVNNAAAGQPKEIIKGYAPLTVNLQAKVVNADGEVKWLKDGKKFDPYKENIFHKNASLECRMKGLDGKVYSKYVEIQILPKEFNFSATANSSPLTPQRNGQKISGDKPFVVKFESNSTQNVTWLRSGRRFVPNKNGDRFEKSEEVKCIYSSGSRKVELYVNVEVQIPPPAAPVINVAANGVMLDAARGKASLQLDAQKGLKFEFISKENVTRVEYYRDNTLFNPERDKITRSCEIKVCAYNSAGHSTSRYISVNIPLKLAKLTATTGSAERQDGFLRISTSDKMVNVTFGLDTQLQLDELEKYQVCYGKNTAKIQLKDFTWQQSFNANEPHLVTLFYNGKECDKFTIQIQKLHIIEKIAKLQAKAGNQGIDSKKQMKARTPEQKITVDFSLDAELQKDNLQKYEISYGDNSGKITLEKNQWQHSFDAGKTYQITLFHKGQECDEFTLNVIRVYNLQFNAVSADNSETMELEDGSRTLTLKGSQTVHFTLTGISPNIKWNNLKFTIRNTKDTENAFSADLATLREARKKALAEAEEFEAEEPAATASPKKTVEIPTDKFSWIYDGFVGNNTYEATLTDNSTLTPVEYKVTIFVIGDMPPFPWVKVLCLIVVLAGGFWWYMRRNITISCQEGDGTITKSKTAKGTLELNKKFKNNGPDLKLTIEADKIIVFEPENGSMEWGVGNNPTENIDFDEKGQAKRKFAGGSTKAITIKITQAGYDYTIVISK